MFMPMPLEILRQLYDEEIVYRPPIEANSILVDVAYGCKWSHCAFCRESVSPRWRVSSLDTVRRKLEILASLPGIERHPNVFLLGEDDLALDMDFLVPLFKDIHRLLPHVQKINMYGCVRDVLRKGADDMLRLKALGLGDLYVGVESGSDAVLKLMLKGTSAKALKQGFDLLDSVGIPYALSSIIGLGGREMIEEHISATAALYNSIHPKSIRLMTLTPVKKTPLWDMIEQGKFTPLDPYEILLEEQSFLEQLHLEDCLLIATHISNNVPLMGWLPQDKQRMLNELREELAAHDPKDWHKRDFENM